MNTPIQGTAADIIKIAMNRVSKALSEKLPSAKLVMQVHDELICECDIKDFELVSGRDVIRPNVAGLMGAFGAALIAQKRGHEDGRSNRIIAAQTSSLSIHLRHSRIQNSILQ